jgi:hypothetical protein
LQVIASLVETICSSLDQSQLNLQEFRDIADRILDYYNQSGKPGQSHQYIGDMHMLLQNLIRSA